MKTKTKTTLGFFGAGKMAEGILAAAAVVPGFDPSQVLMAERIPERAAELEKKYGVRTTPNAADVARAARVIFLAVRPQDVAALAADVKPILTKRHLVVSIAAGKSLSTLRKALGRDVRLVRVMPNLALRAREGMCAICPAKNATPADVRKVAKILNAAGRTAVLEERHFDAVTALSGSGPAFFAFMEQAMAEGGRAPSRRADDARHRRVPPPERRRPRGVHRRRRHSRRHNRSRHGRDARIGLQVHCRRHPKGRRSPLR